jgi:hypothetical protein
MSWNGTKHGPLSHQCVVHQVPILPISSDSLCRLSRDHVLQARSNLKRRSLSLSADTIFHMKTTLTCGNHRDAPLMCVMVWASEVTVGCQLKAGAHSIHENERALK